MPKNRFKDIETGVFGTQEGIKKPVAQRVTQFYFIPGDDAF